MLYLLHLFYTLCLVWGWFSSDLSKGIKGNLCRIRGLGCTSLDGSQYFKGNFCTTKSCFKKLQQPSAFKNFSRTSVLLCPPHRSCHFPKTSSTTPNSHFTSNLNTENRAGSISTIISWDTPNITASLTNSTSSHLRRKEKNPKRWILGFEELRWSQQMPDLELSTAGTLSPNTQQIGMSILAPKEENPGSSTQGAT